MTQRAAETGGASARPSDEIDGIRSHACPECGSVQRHPRFFAEDPLGAGRFALVTCDGCLLTYVDPRPDESRMEAYYASCYYGSRHPALKDFLMDLRARQIGSIAGCGRLLDVGCGAGDFLLACRKRGWDVVGVEQGGAPAMSKQTDLGFHVIDPGEMRDLPDDEFEVVTVWHVLEHIADPRGTLREIRRVLAPGGRVVIEVPNFGGWQSAIGGADWFHIDVPRHLLHFERRSLDRMLQDAGFEAVRWSTFSLEYDTFGLLQTLLNKVCNQPNHLFQLLIGKPVIGSPRDTAISAVLALPLGVVSAVVSFLAPLFGKGGVLRVTARQQG